MAKKEKKTKAKSEVTYDIEKVYGFLDNGNKIYARISWNGGKAKDEVRNVWYDKEGNMKLGRGIDLSDSVFDELSALHKKKPKPVDFDSVFVSAEGIASRRNDGLKTEDGFIVLHRKNGR